MMQNPCSEDGICGAGCRWECSFLLSKRSGLQQQSYLYDNNLNDLKDFFYTTRCAVILFLLPLQVNEISHFMFSDFCQFFVYFVYSLL